MREHVRMQRMNMFGSAGAVLAFFLVFIMSGWPGSITSAAEEENFYEGMTWEEIYTAKHQEFMQSSDYMEIVKSAEGGLAAVIKKEYENAKLNVVNGSWQMFDNTVRFVFDGEATEKTEEVITMTNKYDLIITDLMYATASSMYVSSFDDLYYKEWEGMLDEISMVLKAGKESIDVLSLDSESGSDVLDTADDIVYFIDQFKLLHRSVDAADGGGELLGEKLDAVKKKLNKSFNLDQLTGITSKLKAAGIVGDVAFGTVSDTIDAYCLFKASSGATEEWKKAWQRIANIAIKDGTKENVLIGQSVNGILNEISLSEKSFAGEMMAGTGEHLAKNVIVKGTELGMEAFQKAIDKTEIGMAIHMGMQYGVELADMVTGMDSVAYYGNMMYLTGNIALVVQKAMDEAAEYLSELNSYSSAKMFHEKYHIYQAVQLYACDMGIAYSMAIADTPLGYVFKYQSDDEIAGSVQLQAYKAKLLDAPCHEMSQGECREALTEVGYTSVRLERVNDSYVFAVKANEISHARCKMYVDAGTGYLTMVQDESCQINEDENVFGVLVANLWNRKRCRMDERFDAIMFSGRIQPLSQSSIDDVMTELGYVSWQYGELEEETRKCTVFTYYYSAMDYVLMLDRVSGIAASTIDDFVLGYVDLYDRTIVVGDPVTHTEREDAKREKEQEAGEQQENQAGQETRAEQEQGTQGSAGGRMTREEADAAVTQFFGSAALETYSFVNDQEDGMLYYIDNITNMTIEVNLDTGVLTRINYRGVIFETYQYGG